MGQRRRLVVLAITAVFVTVALVAIVAVLVGDDNDASESTIAEVGQTLLPSVGATTFVGGPQRYCKTAGSPQPLGEVASDEIGELSGLVASRRQPNVLWVHNDSGDRARVFAIDSSGNLLAQVEVAGVDAIDWEDITLLPGRDGQPDSLVVADIGDNFRQRDFVQLVRFAEPELPADPASVVRVTDAVVTTYRYDDGAHDAEAIFFDPLSDELFVITKGLGENPQLYLAGPSLGDDTRALQLIGPVATPVGELITAADVPADGAAIVAQSYEGVFVFERVPGETLGATMQRRPCNAPAPTLPKGEAIGVAPDGTGYYLIAEGVHPTIWYVAV